MNATTMSSNTVPQPQRGAPNTISTIISSTQPLHQNSNPHGCTTIGLINYTHI